MDCIPCNKSSRGLNTQCSSKNRGVKGGGIGFNWHHLKWRENKLWKPFVICLLIHSNGARLVGLFSMKITKQLPQFWYVFIFLRYDHSLEVKNIEIHTCTFLSLNSFLATVRAYSKGFESGLTAKNLSFLLLQSDNLFMTSNKRNHKFTNLKCCKMSFQ